MGRLYLIPVVLVGMLGLTSPAPAQAPPGAALTPVCHSHADLTKMLSQKFAEQPSALGVQANGHLVEVFVSNQGTSWTSWSPAPTAGAALWRWESIGRRCLIP
jgi:hypothetical protein